MIAVRPRMVSCRVLLTLACAAAGLALATPAARAQSASEPPVDVAGSAPTGEVSESGVDGDDAGGERSSANPDAAVATGTTATAADAGAGTPAEADAADTAAQEDTEPAPRDQALRSRSLGDAFHKFRPSEEISADNAVPFPVDI